MEHVRCVPGCVYLLLFIPLGRRRWVLCNWLLPSGVGVACRPSVISRPLVMHVVFANSSGFRPRLHKPKLFAASDGLAVDAPRFGKQLRTGHGRLPKEDGRGAGGSALRSGLNLSHPPPRGQLGSRVIGGVECPVNSRRLGIGPYGGTAAITLQRATLMVSMFPYPTGTSKV
jgi:hypothetical protein